MDRYEDEEDLQEKLLDKAEKYDKELLELAVVAKMAEDWLTGDVGQYIINKVEVDIQEAIAKLINSDPHDFKQVQSAQNDIRVCEMFKVYLKQLIEEGALATQALNNRG